MIRLRKQTTTEPIQGSWKIAEVIKRHPELVDELATINPAFKALQNPIARRVQGSLVTVSQAARVGGIDEGELLRRLNAAIGLASPGALERDGARAAAQAEAPAWTREAPVAAEVDARPLQHAGEEPFSAIMAGVRQVPAGAVLRLRSTFEPTPLYDVLSRRGFTHFARQHADDDWEILFLHRDEPATPAPRPAAPAPPLVEADWSSATDSITIDVSELVPPEPLIRIMEALEALPPGASLLVHHVRRPIHLYARLEEEGYRHQTREPAPGKVELLIEKPA
ncbi:MAG TPA: DUF2249 domain-containing protein [Thermomicrobiaceae bacterium]|nr:DUF2249 domain-containing protein [Thermomicrobiaceae bacterium]